MESTGIGSRTPSSSLSLSLSLSVSLFPFSFPLQAHHRLFTATRRGVAQREEGVEVDRSGKREKTRAKLEAIEKV
jgi:hypothetical protein